LLQVLPRDSGRRAGCANERSRLRAHRTQSSRRPFSGAGVGASRAPLCACTVVDGEEVSPRTLSVEQVWVRNRHPKMPRGWSARVSRWQAQRGSASESDRQPYRLATSELGQHCDCVPGPGFPSLPEGTRGGREAGDPPRSGPTSQCVSGALRSTAFFAATFSVLTTAEWSERSNLGEARCSSDGTRLRTNAIGGMPAAGLIRICSNRRTWNRRMQLSLHHELRII
jgi:hypothetical protein